ncbi:MAG TPA: FxLYD domain-containing protein [Candidatus Limnocylindria bacterium]|nr:FxLYD domain-containing protein [Candidatus Limnocylindria bacterium]
MLTIGAASCASPSPAAFTGRGAELGYGGYRTCRATLRNVGDASALVDLWIDALDASGRAGGACRAAAGRLDPGAERTVEATCPVTASETGAAFRVTDAAGSPLPTRR